MVPLQISYPLFEITIFGVSHIKELLRKAVTTQQHRAHQPHKGETNRHLTEKNFPLDLASGILQRTNGKMSLEKENFREKSPIEDIITKIKSVQQLR